MNDSCHAIAGSTGAPDGPEIALIGNANCGKTTLFNQLTGARQKTGNWPGVTVERRFGPLNLESGEVTLVDLPGIYTIDSSSISPDEAVARDYLQSGKPALVVNVINAANLERGLYLTAQLLEYKLPLVVVLNMQDVARSMGTEIDVGLLTAELGCPVVPTVANRRHGLQLLCTTIGEMLKRPALPSATVRYHPALEEEIERGPDPEGEDTLLRQQRIQRLLHPDRLENTGVSQRLRSAAGEDLEELLADGRYGFSHSVFQAVVRHEDRRHPPLSDRIDRWVLHGFWGMPIFLGVMYLLFLFTINLGGALIDFFDIAAGAIFVESLGEWLLALGAPQWLKVLFADGVGSGIQTVATFIPIIGSLYLFLSIIEDSGYMARAAFVADRLLRKVGLSGTAFVPLIVGFGCNVPAIMASRTLREPRERIVAALMAPFMSCGARLSVYTLFVAAFFPTGGHNIVFLLYLIGILVAVLTGLLLRRTLLQGTAEPFIVELPNYNRPSLRSIGLHTWVRLRSFVLDAGKIIVVMVVIINVMNSLGTDGSFGNEDSDASVLSATAKTVTPLFSSFGIEQENWPATVGILTGILAKEVVVGTLDALYAGLSGEHLDDEAYPGLLPRLYEATLTVPANLGEALRNLGDPLGLSALESTHDQQTAAAEQKVSAKTFGAMASRFNGAHGAFAYLLFILLYFPCAAATAALHREVGGRWAIFGVAWTTGVAYLAATVYYQTATLQSHPQQSLIWLIAAVSIITGTVLVLRYLGQRLQHSQPPLI